MATEPPGLEQPPVVEEDITYEPTRPYRVEINGVGSIPPREEPPVVDEEPSVVDDEPPPFRVEIVGVGSIPPREEPLDPNLSPDIWRTNDEEPPVVPPKGPFRVDVSGVGSNGFNPAPDWRVRLSLAKNSTYLYNANPAGILEPLKKTNGVIFPYMPKIDVQYTAQYDAYDPTHSNYKFHTYRGSSVESVGISGTFTAQDTEEANYLLAVIHFFRSVTKMFYGKDENPSRGTPPPLVYLSGLGAYQFDNHPLAVHSFTYSLPDDVDYINAGAVVGGIDFAAYSKPMIGPRNPTEIRLEKAKLQPGGLSPLPIFTNANVGKEDMTRVPTRIGISIQCHPIVTRDNVSNEFSLKRYATGELLRGSKNGIWGGGTW